MKVYISGPITGISEEVYTKSFEDMKATLMKYGVEPVSPLDLVPQCSEGCESGETFKDGTYRHSWRCYMKDDIIELMNCDAVVLLTGWERSRGARVEVDVAGGFDLPIVHETKLAEVLPQLILEAW